MGKKKNPPGKRAASLELSLTVKARENELEHYRRQLEHHRLRDLSFQDLEDIQCDLTEVHNVLEPHSAVLQYSVIHGEFYALVITETDVSISQPLGKIDDITEWVNQWIQGELAFVLEEPPWRVQASPHGVTAGTNGETVRASESIAERMLAKRSPSAKTIS